MKKSIAIIAAIVLAASAAFAQPRSVGVRLGSGINLSYQHYVPNMDFMKAENAFVTADLDVAWGFNYYGLTGTYNFINPFNAVIPWTYYGNWNWYLGAGAGVNFGGHTDKSGNYADGFEYKTTTTVFGFGIAAQVGIEYEFEFPLTIALEYRPVFGPEFYTTKVATTGPDGKVETKRDGGAAFGTSGTYIGLGLALRYRF